MERKFYGLDLPIYCKTDEIFCEESTLSPIGKFVYGFVDGRLNSVNISHLMRQGYFQFSDQPLISSFMRGKVSKSRVIRNYDKYQSSIFHGLICAKTDVVHELAKEMDVKIHKATLRKAVREEFEETLQEYLKVVS